MNIGANLWFGEHLFNSANRKWGKEIGQKIRETPFSMIQLIALQKKRPERNGQAKSTKIQWGKKKVISSVPVDKV